MAVTEATATGRIIQVLGGVVDVEFPPDQLPEIYFAVEVPRDGEQPLILEVQKHLGNNWVRCLAMDTTEGLQRGRQAINTGGPIKVPVGEVTLGRVFNVLGEPIDGKGPVESSEFYPIHRSAPPSRRRPPPSARSPPAWWPRSRRPSPPSW